MIYKLDNAGRVVDADLYSGLYTFKLTYNPEGYLSKISKTGPNLYDNISYDLSYTDGNLSKISGTALDDFSTKETIECVYSSDAYATLTSNTNPLTYIMMFDTLPGFFGKVSKNLVSSLTQTFINKNGYGRKSHILFLHKKDADGNVNSMTTVSKYFEVSTNNPDNLLSDSSIGYSFRYKCD